MFPDDILDQARAVVTAAIRREAAVATAESCTGGLVAAALTEIAGASAAVERGFVTYSNRAKVELLGVPPETLAAHGAVSEQTARAMAAGARARGRVTASVAVTGVAGPGGGSADKPVGLVWFAADGPLGAVAAERRFGDIGRSAVRLAAVRTALGLLLEQLEA